MKREAITLPVLALLALSGCSASPPQDGPTSGPSTSATASTTSEAAARSLPAGPFKLTTKSGAEISFTLPTPLTDPAVAEIEAYRTKTGGAPVSYLVADVDNRNGTKPINMYMVSAFDEEGRQYTFGGVTQSIDLWSPNYGADGKWKSHSGEILDDAAGDDLQRESVELGNANLNGADIAERKTLILTSSDVNLPNTFTRVAVQPTGAGEGEEAKPAS